MVAGSLVYLPASRYAHGVPLGRDAALAAVDLVAVTRDVARHDGAACGPYQGAPGGVTMAPRVDVDVEVTIVDATTGAAVDRRTFRDGFDDCPMFATFRGDRYELVEARPAVATLEPWLVEVASRRVPSP
ncbi:MAG: hypothetical protein H6708_33960 [Kofleriaceae bacterium]|nr:hypothetical protein [Kofleriaceae bacterium]